MMPYMVKYGKLWTDKDWNDLRSYQKEKKSLEEICTLMGRTKGSIEAAQPRLMMRCANNKPMDEVAVELNITDKVVIEKAKQYLQNKCEKMNEKKLKQENKMKKTTPTQINNKLIYSGKIEVLIDSINTARIKTDSTEMRLNYPNATSELECISEALLTLLKQTNPGAKIKFVTMTVDLDECGKDIDKERLFTVQSMNSNDLLCYSLYKVARELYEIDNYILITE